MTAADELASAPSGAVTDRAAEVRARRVPGVEARAGKFPGPSLIPALNAIQARLGWLPRAELEELARDTRRPRYEIEGLISFYPHFRTDPPAKVTLHVCHDLPCNLAGGEARLAELRERYADDAEVELVEVSCLGRCDTAPAVTVNERPAPVEGRRRARRRRPHRHSAEGVVAGRPGEEARRAVAQRPLPGRVGGRGALRHPARAARRRAGPGHDRAHAEGRRVARDGRGRVPDRAEVGAGPRHRSPAR